MQYNHICTMECIEQGIHVLSGTEQIQFRENLCQEVMGISRAEFIERLKSGRYELDPDAGRLDDNYPVDFISLLFSLTDLELLYVIQARRMRPDNP